MPSIMQLISRQAGPGPDPFAGIPMPITDDRRGDIIAASIVGTVLAILTTIGRFAARRRTKAAIKADDWLIVGGLIMALGVVASTFVMVHYGLGRHINLVTNPAGMVQSVVASQILYSLSVIPIKLSILSLYHRLFPSPNLKWLALAVAILTILYSLAQAIVMGLQCIPLESMWNPEIKGSCLNMSPFYTTMAIINVATDVFILTLPLPYIWNLSLQKARKVQLVAVFMTGAAVIAFGIIRAVNVGSASPIDQPWSDTNAAMWSVLEICVGVVSANLPCLRPLFFWLPSAIRGSTGGTANSKAKAGSHATPGASKRTSTHNGNAYEMARRSRIIGASKNAGWESLDDSRVLTRISDEHVDEKRVSVVQTSNPVSPLESVADARANSQRNSRVYGGGMQAQANPRSIVVQTTIETKYEDRN